MFLGKDLADLATDRQLISYDFLVGCAEAWYEAGAGYHEGDREEESLGSTMAPTNHKGSNVVSNLVSSFRQTMVNKCWCLAFVHILCNRWIGSARLSSCRRCVTGIQERTVKDKAQKGNNRKQWNALFQTGVFEPTVVFSLFFSRVRLALQLHRAQYQLHRLRDC